MRLSPNVKMVLSCYYIAKVFRRHYPIRWARDSSGPQPKRLVGLTGLEPVTLRLSSACSNQLSYRPKSAPSTNDSKRQRRQLPLTFVVVHWCSLASALATGGKGTRTPDL